MTCGEITPQTCTTSDGNMQGRIVPQSCCVDDAPQEQLLNKIWKRNRWMGIDTRPEPYGYGSFSTGGGGFLMGPPQPGNESTSKLSTRIIVFPPEVVTPSGVNSQPVDTGAQN